MRARLAFLLFVFCFSVHADTQTTVGNWTANLLTTVLSARYDDPPKAFSYAIARIKSSSAACALAWSRKKEK